MGELGNYKEAIDRFDRVLKTDSDRAAEVWFLKGHALLSLGSSDVQFCFDKARELGFEDLE